MTQVSPSGSGTGLPKRFFDVTVSSLALLVFSPVLATLAALVALKLGTPVFFRQRRPGLNGEPFELLKLRTMTDARGPDGQLLPDADRVTNFGRFLRASSLDELPSLWNVVRGDMSLVGPRPLLMEYLPRYDAVQARRHEVKPGLTGLAQVSGRNAISWDEKFALDVRYVDHQSFGLDLKILFATIGKVISRHGISAADHATMPVFTGSQGSDESRRDT